MLALSPAFLLLIVSAATVHAATKIAAADFGKTHDGSPIRIFTLTNAHGVEARISTYGGAVVSLKVPDRGGVLADVVQGFDSLDGYLDPSSRISAR